MGRFYNTMTFSDFLTRLYQKRYRSLFLDGHLLVPRDDNDVLAATKYKFDFTHFFLERTKTDRNRDILLSVGTDADHTRDL